MFSSPTVGVSGCDVASRDSRFFTLGILTIDHICLPEELSITGPLQIHADFTLHSIAYHPLLRRGGTTVRRSRHIYLTLRAITNEEIMERSRGPPIHPERWI